MVMQNVSLTQEMLNSQLGQWNLFATLTQNPFSPSFLGQRGLPSLLHKTASAVGHFVRQSLLDSAWHAVREAWGTIDTAEQQASACEPGWQPLVIARTIFDGWKLRTNYY